MKSNTGLAVAGGGVAGLAVAIAAARAGHRVTIFERDATISTGGAVLLLWPNGVKAATHLGIGGELRKAGTRVKSTEFKLWNDSRLGRLDVESFERRFGAPAILISRESLVGILSAAVPAAVTRHWGVSCVGFDVAGGKVVPRVERTSPSPPVGCFDGLVGCDGLGSRVREALRGKEKTRPAHHVAWIGLSDRDEATWSYPVGHTVAFLGQGLRLCASTMKNPVPASSKGSRRVYWYATEAVSDGTSRKYVSGRELVRMFSEVQPAAGALIRSAVDLNVLPPTPFPICDRWPVRRWSYGPVTLCGDAAHPSTPDLGQGACQALESALLLGRMLERCDDIPDAFQRYERKRMEPTALVTEMSRLTAVQSMARGPYVDSLREMGIRTILPSITERVFEGLFSIES